MFVRRFCCGPDGNAVIRHRFYGERGIYAGRLGMMNNVVGDMQSIVRAAQPDLGVVLCLFQCGS